MGRQLIAMEMGVGIMPGRKGRFGDRMVRRVRQGVDRGVVFGILDVALLVIAGV
jgi:hypothetical protein